MTNDQRRAGEMKLVPVDPQPEMLAAFWRVKNTGSTVPGEFGEDRSDYAAYRAMLDASPLPDGGGDRTGAGDWVTVPRAITAEMLDAAVKGSRADVSYADVEELWPAVLEAAPAVPASPISTGAGVEGAVLTDPGSREPSPAVSASGFDPSRDAVQRVCHEEQMTIWTGEIGGSLSMGGYLREDLTYEDILDVHAVIASDLTNIIKGAFRLATTEGCGPKDESPVAAAKASPSHPPGQAVSQSIAGEDDLRAEIQSAFEAWGYPAYSTVMEGFEAGYRAALARSPAAGAGQDLQLALTKLYRHALNCPGAEYDEDGIENALRILSAALAPAPSPQVERAWLTRTKLEEVARAIKTALEQRGHVQFSKGAEYGHVTDGGINTIVEILGRLETIPSPAPAQKG